MSDSEIECTPPNLRKVAEAALAKLLPPKSKKLYEKRYAEFKNWCSENKVAAATENVLIAYFEFQYSKGYKSSTLWSVSTIL